MRYIIYFYYVVDKNKRSFRFLKDKTKRIEVENDEEAIKECKRLGGSLLVKSERKGRTKGGKFYYKHTSIYRSKIFD